ncbi:MAG: di-heme oxidoredictase family protein [Kofleriaceae bacterium]
MKALAWLGVALVVGCGHDPHSTAPDAPPGASDASPPEVARGHSSSIAISADGTQLVVVNADSDSISIVAITGGVAIGAATEIALGPPPTVDASGAFTPAVMPRALALAPDGASVLVTGERSGRVYRVALADHTVTASAVICSEPIGVLAASDAVYVACSNERAVVKLDGSLAEVARTPLASPPWGLAWGPDGALVASLFYGPGAVVLDPATLAIRTHWDVPAVAPRGDARLAHGVPRGFYDLVTRPGTQEMWMVHELLGTDTPQPALDFERTAFPAITVVANGTGPPTVSPTLSTDAQDVAGIDGSFGDVVSGPHALEFTHDGAYALVVDTNSEDVLVVGANRVEAALVRPLPGHMPEGIAISPDDKFAYLDERNTGDIAVLGITRTATGISLAAQAPPIARYAVDPMPAQLRFGQHLFYSANSDEYPVTQNHWIACATCHMEGRSDEVTWLFGQGPRDTPSNAGGMLGTGFLFRTADRTQVQDYWHTINVEQGGSFDPVAQAALLDAIEAYVDHAIPLPVPPATDAVKVARGAALFARADVGCASCHPGPHFTDSGSGNPTLDLAGPVVLHDVGTCNPADVAHDDVAGHARAACQFDTPALNGVWSAPPYFHDGRAATLHDAVEISLGTATTTLSADDEDALVEYLRSL